MTTAGDKFEQSLRWQRSLSLHAPVSGHHWRAVNELWSMLEGRGIRDALEIGAGEPPYLTARMLREHGIAAYTSDGLSPCDFPSDCHDLQMPDNMVDLVVARHVLEHVLCPYLVVHEMTRVSRRWLLVVVPGTSDKARTWPDHLWHLDHHGWERIWEMCGLAIVDYALGDHSESPAWVDEEHRYLLRRRE